jgi:spore germination cell wall hydrolase CwlJ-like protein
MNKKSGRILQLTVIAIFVLTATSIVFHNSDTLSGSKGIKVASNIGYLHDKEVVSDNSSTADQATIAVQQPPAPAPEPVETSPAAEAGTKKTTSSINRGGSGVTNKTAKAPSSSTSTTAKVQKAAASPKPALYTVRGNGRSYSITAEERSLLARLVSAEASGESYEGKLAVATVVINRVVSGTFPGSVTQVIMGKESGYYQFTPVMDGRINNAPSADALRAVDQVLKGYRSFPAKVMWFLNPQKSTSLWILNYKTYFKTIGNHTFYY